jgi:type VI secretion system secreted protein VgrG
MPDYKQAGRLMQFTSTLGQDELLIENFEGIEGISRLFEFSADLLGDAATEIDPADIVGTKATLALGLLDVQGTRYFNGVVAAFEQTSGDDEFSHYRAQIVPSLWLLTLSTNCRVFQGLAVMAIIKQVISTYGLSVSDVTTETYQPLDYCTQYNETDFNFVSRLAEQFGIFYYFEHKSGDNTVVFADSRSAYSPCPLVSKVQYSPQPGKEDIYHSVISDIRATATLVTGIHSSRDVDFLTYSPHVMDPVSSTAPTGANSWERYHFPAGEAGYVKLVSKALPTPNHGKTSMGAQRDASDVPSNQFHGTSSARSFQPGFTFDQTMHPRSAWNQTYLLTEVMHSAQQAPPYRARDNASGQPYSNRFVAIESTRTFRPAAHTPKPRIMGPQTAMVVTPQGEDLYLDKQGRVCIQFFWDRLRKSNTIDNTWVRVAQPWAGNGWGTYFWPRVNDEVVVQFLDGDPDKPVVSGSVYNGVNMAKYALPDMSTRTGIVTRSSKSGTADNANELRFEDKKGSEQIFLNAEMDMDHRIENDSRRFVGGKDSLMVTGNQLEQITGDRHTEVKGATVDKIGKNLDLDVGTDVNGKVGQNFSLNVGQNMGEKVGMNYALDSGMEVYIKAGMSVVIESGLELTLKGAGGFINIGPAGIAISGTLVMINSGGAAGAGSPPQLTPPGPPTKPDEADDGSKGGKKS